MVASNSRCPQFESSHWQKFILNIYYQLHWKDENKEKEAGNGRFFKNKVHIPSGWAFERWCEAIIQSDTNHYAQFPIAYSSKLYCNEWGGFCTQILGHQTFCIRNETFSKLAGRKSIIGRPVGAKLNSFCLFNNCLAYPISNTWLYICLLMSCSWCYKTFFGGNLDFSKIKKLKKVCSDVWTCTKMWKQCHFQQNFIQILFIDFKMAYSCWFSSRGNLDFLKNFFYNINYWSYFFQSFTRIRVRGK